MIKNSVESNNALVELNDGYIHIRFTDMSIIGLEEAMDISEHIIALCDGKKYPFITNGLGITIRMDQDARNHFATYKPLVKVRKAQAIIVNNIPSKLLANFYIKFHKPSDPTKIFTKFDDAVDWIRTFS
jgi:hypothetical protein